MALLLPLSCFLGLSALLLLLHEALDLLHADEFRLLLAEDIRPIWTFLPEGKELSLQILDDPVHLIDGR